MLSKFKDWCISNNLDIHHLSNNIFKIGDTKYYFLERDEVFTEDFELNLPEDLPKNIDYIVYNFGTKFYYTERKDWKKPKLNLFKYIGVAKQELENTPYYFLGIHGKYELLNGSRDYKEWVKKALFLKVDTLGLCEKNTLAGTLPFQSACSKKGIKSILGETVVVKTSKEELYEIKLYVKNEVGWKNLLYINTQINVVNDTRCIYEQELFSHAEGLFCVLSPISIDYDKLDVDSYKTAFKDDNLYFQLDGTTFINNDTDRNYLVNVGKFLESSISSVLLNDAYYLDKDEHKAKSILNSISSFKEKVSHNQYFKSINDMLNDLQPLFDEESFEDIFLTSYSNLLFIRGNCDYKIPTGSFKFPQYPLTEEELREYGDRDNMFFSLIEEGLSKLNLSDEEMDIYIDRIAEECRVLQLGGYFDYFLILRDIVNYCHANDILLGFGRGCFAPDMLVKTTVGDKKIQDIEIGDIVYGRKGPNEVINKFEYEVDEELIELELDNGQKIICTKDHKIYTKNRGYVEAQDLTQEDILMDSFEELK